MPESFVHPVRCYQARGNRFEEWKEDCHPAGTVARTF